MTGLRLGVVISLVLLGGVASAEGSKNVSRPVDDTQQFEQGKKIAIVVGVESYNERLSGFRALDYAKDDAEQVAGILKNLGYQVDLLVDGEASRDIILNRIRQKAKLPGINNGTLVFYFSGHGFTAGEDNYLATSGAVADMLQDSGLGLSKVVESIRTTGVRRAVLMVDACRNNPRPGAKGGVSGYADIDPGEGVQILYSTRFGDVSWENDAFKHGVFSHFLAEGLSGQGAQNGLVTFNSLANYVEQQVSGWTDRNMSQTQQPFRRSDGDFHGDFVLARLGAASVPPPAPAAPVVVVAPEPEPVVAPTPVPPAAPVAKSSELKMVDIPAGTFTMGCDANRDNVEGGCSDDEKPPHEVTVNAFKLAKTEVTVAQFRAFVEATDYKTTAETAGSCYSLDEKGAWSDVKGNSWRKLGFEQTDNDPVACVSWADTRKYLEWLNGAAKPDKPYRLPTEAEWEYAARGGKGGAYPWGQKGSDGCGYANMADQKAKEKYPDWITADCNDGYIYTAPVGKFQPNGFGLYDMQGNVWEWVEDWYASDYYKSSPASAPQGASTGTYRVIRGGSWDDGPWSVRSANRDDYTPDNRNGYVGFRLAQGQ